MEGSSSLRKAINNCSMKLWVYIPSILILSHLNSSKIVWFHVEGFFLELIVFLWNFARLPNMVQTLMQEDYWPHGSFSCFQSNGKCHVLRKGVASCPSSHRTHVITKKEVSNQLFQLHTKYMSIKFFIIMLMHIGCQKSTCGA